MADNGGKAQSSLGQLFVEFGTKGLDKMMKGLNGISAQFLLTKNAAEQAIKPIIGFSKEASNRIVGYDKINAVTGLSIKRLQEMDRWAKLNNVDFNSYVGQVQGLQQAILKFRLEGVRNKGFDLLGIDPSSFDYRNPEQALKIISNRVSQLDEATGALALSYLGLDANLMYAFTHANRQLDESIALTDEQNARLMEQNKQWNYFNDVVTLLKDKIATTGPIAQGLQYLIDLSKDWIHIIDDTDGTWSNFKANIKDTIRPLTEVFNSLVKIYEKIMDIEGVQKTKKRMEENLTAHPFVSRINPVLGDALTQLDKTNIANANLYDTSKSPLSVGNLTKALLHPIQTRDVLLAEKAKRDITINQYINSNDPIGSAQESYNKYQQAMNNTASNNGDW